MKMPSQLTFAGMAGLAALAWLSFAAVVAASQRKLIFNPARIKEVERPRSVAHRTRPVGLRSADGTRRSGWLSSRDAGRMFPNMTVLAINYRGYGDSAGVPGETQMIADAYMLFDWMAERYNVDPAKIAVVGRSLGSGVAVQVAVHRPVAALVLVTPYDSLV